MADWEVSWSIRYDSRGLPYRVTHVFNHVGDKVYYTLISHFLTLDDAVTYVQNWRKRVGYTP